MCEITGVNTYGIGFQTLRKLRLYGVYSTQERAILRLSMVFFALTFRELASDVAELFILLSFQFFYGLPEIGNLVL